MGQIHPDMLKPDDSFMKIVNAASLTKLMVHEQAKQGNLNARYLSSVISLAGKYLPDDIRLPMIEKTFYEIDKMKINEDVKMVLKTGVSLGNIDYIGKIAKDPVL